MMEIEVDDRPLTPLQARFAEEYLLDLNAGQAAKRAGSTANDLYVAGHEFLRNPKVAAHIQKLQAERSARTGMTADKLLEMLAEEATADMSQLYDDDGNIKPIHLWPMVFRRGLVVGIEVETKYERTSDGDVKDLGKIGKIKITDRSKIKELIGRHVGVQAFRENVSLSGAIGVAVIPVQNLTDDQLRLLASIPTTNEGSK